MTPISVIMIDSEKRLLNATEKYLHSKGISILTTTDPENLLKKISKNPPDCIIMDNITYHQKKILLIDRLKQTKKFQHIPIILLTTKGLTNDRINGYNIGCNIYIPKPFDPKELESIIKSIKTSKKVFTEHIVQNYLAIKEIRSSLAKKCNGLPSLKLNLTQIEIQILEKLLSGLNSKSISEELEVSKRNIENYICRLMDKTQTKSTTELKMLPWSTILIKDRANDGDRTRE